VHCLLLPALTFWYAPCGPRDRVLYNTTGSTPKVIYEATKPGFRFWANVGKKVRHMLSDRCLSCLSVCDVGVLWPNGWMDQDATWYGGRPRLRQHCVRRGPSSPTARGTIALRFGPCLLWLNGCPSQQLISCCCVCGIFVLRLCYAKRLAGKNVFEMTYFVSSGT